MPKEFMSQTDLGKIYGVSRNKIGQWLVDVGLRTEDKNPSQFAHDGGYVRRELSTNPGTYFWVWQADKTMQVFDNAGYRRAENAQCS
jgi:hypothetical protein